MASVFEPSQSTSRQPQGPSMADTLPSIAFGFDDLRDRMARFTTKFDAFIEQGRKRLLEERNQFRMNVAELQEDQRMKKKDIEILQLKTNTHQQVMAKEAAEMQAMQTQIASLTAQRDKQATTRDALRSRSRRRRRTSRRGWRRSGAHAAQQESQARFNVPELDFWVTYLCMRIEGAGAEDRLKFVYTHVDEKNWDREAWFELCTGSRDYDVRHCRPKLEREKVERVLERVNETRELSVLLKGMRELFVEALKS
ncbi:chromosome segregation protein Spc25-domain-containing protein [Podospora appendiculata]|uniref:Kinetochore protein SPC25 n=1 Tax=Podospora appendiculata TaxID=314037 RepID=A0AAE1C6Z2_9PEZI|nr:chromosome segregation protein Spc25-domain-containing protein [Podospora appendiculata]